MPRSTSLAAQLTRTGAAALLIAMILGAPVPAAAGTQLYSYDSLGRLTRTCGALPFDSELTQYVFDARDNRGAYTNFKLDVWIPAGTGLSSPDGRFTLWMQTDGNLVLYQNSNGQALWATGTNGSGANVAYLQSDGNLVVYASAQGVWASNSHMPCGYLSMQNDGNLVIYSPDHQPVWATNTGGH